MGGGGRVRWREGEGPTVEGVGVGWGIRGEYLPVAGVECMSESMLKRGVEVWGAREGLGRMFWRGGSGGWRGGVGAGGWEGREGTYLVNTLQGKELRVVLFHYYLGRKVTKGVELRS